MELHDEGWVSPSATSIPGEDPKTKLFVGEPLARWNGWSRGAPRPGQHIGSDDLPADPSDNPPQTEFAVSLTFAAKNLPRLRFGRTYRLRARVADLAGNGVAAPVGTAHTSPPLEYRRFDPVSAPAVVLHELPEEGEAVARLVIRTFNDAESKDGVVSPDVTERHLAPPQVSQLLAEAHGRFDGMAPLDAYTLAAEREGTYEDLVNPMTGIPYAPAGPTGIELVVVAPAPPADPAQPALPPSEPYTVVVHHEDSAPLPFLADPLARGVALLGMPWADHDRFLGLPSAPLDKQTEFHSDGTVTVTQLFDKPEVTLVMVDLGPEKGWPDLLPFRLRAVEGSAPPAFDAAARVLTVGLPKAMVARTRASSYVDVAALKVLGIWGWVAGNAAAPHADLERLTLQGRHHMMTPWRDLVLVHAVQQPIGHPVLGPGLMAVRHLGETFATVTGSLAAAPAQHRPLRRRGALARRPGRRRHGSGLRPARCRFPVRGTRSARPWSTPPRTRNRRRSTPARSRTARTSVTPGTGWSGTRRWVPRGSASTSRRAQPPPASPPRSSSTCRARRGRPRPMWPTSCRPSAGSARRRARHRAQACDPGWSAGLPRAAVALLRGRRAARASCCTRTRCPASAVPPPRTST